MRDDKALTRWHKGCPEGKERRGRCQRKNEETGMWGGGEESVGWHSGFQLEQVGWQNCQSPGQRIRKEQGKGWGRGEVPLRHGMLGGPANPGQEAGGKSDGTSGSPAKPRHSDQEITTVLDLGSGFPGLIMLVIIY